MADNLSRDWGRIRKAAEACDVSIHDMGRTYPTRLLRAGVAPGVVQELLGHSSLVTTMKYYISTEDADKQEAAARLMATV